MFNREVNARHFNRRLGMGFGFKGYSPPWPYTGRGRGGLPRCEYFTGATRKPLSRQDELNDLKSRAEFLKNELKDLEAEIQSLAEK